MANSIENDIFCFDHVHTHTNTGPYQFLFGFLIKIRSRLAEKKHNKFMLKLDTRFVSAVSGTMRVCVCVLERCYVTYRTDFCRLLLRFILCFASYFGLFLSSFRSFDTDPNIYYRFCGDSIQATTQAIHLVYPIRLDRDETTSCPISRMVYIIIL